MIIRTVLAVAAIAVGVTSVVAQQDPIAARKALMKANGEQNRVATDMLEGKAPFNLDAAKKVLTTFAESSDKSTGLYPDNTKTGDTAALPAVWDKKADFDAKLAKFGRDAKAAAVATTNLDTFKAQLSEVRKNCGGCHQDYRRRAS